MYKKLGLVGTDAFINMLKAELKHFQVYSSNIPSVLTSLKENIRFNLIVSEFDIPETFDTPSLIVSDRAPLNLNLTRQYIHSSAPLSDVLRRIDVLYTYVDQVAVYEKIYSYGQNHSSVWSNEILNQINHSDLLKPSVIMGEKGTGKHWYLNLYLNRWKINKVFYVHHRDDFLKDLEGFEPGSTLLFSKFDQAEEKDAEIIIDFIHKHNAMSVFLVEHAPGALALQTFFNSANIIFVPPVRKRPECIDFYVEALFDSQLGDAEVSEIKFELMRFHWPQNLIQLKKAMKVYLKQGFKGLKNHIDDLVAQPYLESTNSIN